MLFGGDGPGGFDFDRSGLAGGVVPEATPGIVFGFGDEATDDGIAMDVTDLFDMFGRREDVEVELARLPEVVERALQEL